MKSILMNSQAGQTHPVLRPRMRDVGILLLVCTDVGELELQGAAVENEAGGQSDWLENLLCAAPMFKSALREAARRWAIQHDPATAEVIPGLWIAPIPLKSRRRRVGYSLAIIPTEKFLDSEHFTTLCNSARADYELSRSLLAALPPAASTDVDRIATLVRYAHDDTLRLASDGQAVENVGKQLAESYEEMNLLYTIIQSMTVQQRPERFVAIACEELLGTLPYAWIGTQFCDDRSQLKSLSGRLIFAGEPGRPADTLRTAARKLFQRTYPGEAIVLQPQSNPQHAAFADLGEMALVHPVSSDGKVIGVLIAGDKKGADNAASSADMKLLGATATHMAIFLENAALYDDLNAMFLGTLEALTASIDAKDRYTCGHSRRVAQLTQQLAQAVGLEQHTIDRMHIAGMVHDVGKIGVPEAVLLKPGKLTADEFAWIRLHPEMGFRILKDIPQLHDVLPGVLHHHERWDGKGYPEGLAGEAIPLVARLIALADSFDAMSSSRTYRSALTRREVQAEIIRCAGTQFDPSLAPIFVKLDFSEYDRMVLEHQAADLGLPLRQHGEAA